MPIASTYPLLDIFWTILEIFLFVVWIWLFILVVGDIITTQGMNGWSKALWVLAVLVLPLLGVLIYLLIYGSRMGERRRRADGRPGPSIGTPTTGGSTSSADELSKLADLRTRGALSEEEFAAQKAKLLD